MLTVVTTSTDDRLTSLDRLKRLLTISTTAEDDLLQDSLLDATDAVSTFLGYYPLRQTYRETLQGFGDNTLMLSRFPVVQMLGLYYLSTQTVVHPNEYTVEKPNSGLIVRDLGFPWSAGIEWDLDSHLAPGSEKRVFIADYIAGYTFSTGAGRTLPHDIERAALDVAKALYQAGSRDMTIAAKTVGALSISYASQSQDYNMSAVPASARALLQPYRQMI